MELDYQKKIVSFLLRTEKAAHLHRHVDKHIVDDPGMQEIIGLWMKYSAEYSKPPDETILNRMLDKEVERSHQQLDKETITDLRYLISDAFRTDPGEMVETDVLEYCRNRQTENVLDDINSKLYGKHKGDVGALLIEAQKKFAEISRIGSDHTGDKGRFFIEDHNKHIDDIPDGIPTFLKGLNKVTDAGGFHTPQLITLMGPPKSFKTGLMLNLALDYAKKGLNVFYADFENGQNIIDIKMQQSLLNATLEEAREGKYQSELNSIFKKIRNFKGGDIRIEEFQARKDTLKSAEARLDYLEYEYGWTPDVIFWDYLDLAETEDKSITERRLKIQTNYHEAININKRRNTFCFTVSKVKRDAFKKDPIDIGDFGEDSEKPYNAHAAFAIISDEDEKGSSLARLQVVAQRQGLPPEKAPPILLYIDGARIQCKELTEDVRDYMEQGHTLKEAVEKAHNLTRPVEGKTVNDGLDNIQNFDPGDDAPF